MPATGTTSASWPPTPSPPRTDSAPGAASSTARSPRAASAREGAAAQARHLHEPLRRRRPRRAAVLQARARRRRRSSTTSSTSPPAGCGSRPAAAPPATTASARSTPTSAPTSPASASASATPATSAWSPTTSSATSPRPTPSGSTTSSRGVAEGAPALAAGDTPGFLNAVARRMQPPAPPKPPRRSSAPATPAAPRRPSPRTPRSPLQTAGRPLPLTVATPSALQAEHCAAHGLALHRAALHPPRGPPRARRPVADRVLGWPGDPAAPTPCRCGWPAPCTAWSSKARDPGLAAVYPPHEAPTTALWAAVSTALARARALSPRPPRRPAADQRGPAHRRALPRVPDRRRADRPAARHLRARGERRAQPARGTASPTASAPPAWGDPASRAPHRARLARVRRRRCRPRGSPSAPAATAAPLDIGLQRRGPAAAPLLRLGRPDRADGAHVRRDRDLPRAPGIRVETADARRLARPPADARVPAGRMWSITRSSGRTSRRGAGRGSSQPRTPPAARASAEAPLAWLRLEGDGAEPGAAITPDALARRRDAGARPGRFPRRLGALGRLGLTGRRESAERFNPDYLS